jgi:hypothetical protein
MQPVRMRRGVGIGRHLNACKEEIRLILNGEHSQKTIRPNPALNGSHDGVRLIVYTGHRASLVGIIREGREAHAHVFCSRSPAT